MKPPPLAGDAALKLAHAETSGDPAALQVAYEQLFCLCYCNRLDPHVILREAEAFQLAEVA